MTYHNHLQPMSDVECLNFLDRARFGHLGFINQGQVEILPINFIFRDGYIYSHSLEGHKLEAMRKNPHVCIQTDQIENMNKWQSVQAWGRFEECLEDDGNRVMRDLIKNLQLSDQSWGNSALELDFSALLERAIIYRIKIQKFVGRSEGI